MKSRRFPLVPSILAAGVALAVARALGPAHGAPQVLAQAHKTPMQTAPPRPARIEWDARTLVRVVSGTYGRMIRLRGIRDGGILCCYEAGGKSWVVRSRDDGKSWGPPLLVKEIARASAANPELLQLKSGRLLLFYNQRPHRAEPPAAPAEERLRFGIGVCLSDDNGRTWRSGDPLVFQAGHDAERGCWEPAGIQLPSGEVQLFFANEAPYAPSHDQEITRLRSHDGGASWSAPEKVAHRAGHRDGMPVPLMLRDGMLLLGIEDNGLAPGNSLQPAIISLGRGQKLPSVDGTSHRRWGAASLPLPGSVYAGAPYIVQMAGGETILSCQSNEGGRQQPAMTVYVGDSQARRFQNPTLPFATPTHISGSWNALFVKDTSTITAISDTVIDGVHGLWAIDGRLVRSTGSPQTGSP